jgi:hypothetical protein
MADRPRSLYGPVHEVEPRRLAAEHFTIFISADSSAATLIQATDKQIKITTTTVLSRGR